MLLRQFDSQNSSAAVFDHGCTGVPGVKVRAFSGLHFGFKSKIGSGSRLSITRHDDDDGPLMMMMIIMMMILITHRATFQKHFQYI